MCSVAKGTWSVVNLVDSGERTSVLVIPFRGYKMLFSLKKFTVGAFALPFYDIELKNI